MSLLDDDEEVLGSSKIIIVEILGYLDLGFLVSDKIFVGNVLFNEEINIVFLDSEVEIVGV